ncbi:MAG TPA: tetratricopeptide repeat protein [Spirochaetota bacterium]|nr:tetratricopeptide repeat protein [Spirochaetota bacterium]HPQ51650.1 tetratricopeptide repeat protein [Spirochaetota bacterium]
MTKNLYTGIFLAVLLITGQTYAAGNETNTRNGNSFSVDNDWLWYSEALLFRSNKEYGKAIEYLKKSALSGHELHRVYYQIAQCYYSLHDYEKATSYARKSIKVDNTFENPYLLTYKIFLRLKNYNSASNTLESLLSVKPGNIKVHYSLGNIYYNNLKNYEKAQHHFEEIIKISKKQVVDEYYKEYAHYYLGYLFFNKQDVDKSIYHFKSVLELNPDNNSAMFIVTSLLMESYRLNEAEKYCRNYLARFPQNSRINFFLGRIFYLRDDLEASKYFRKSGMSMNREGLVSKALSFEMSGKDENLEKLLKFVIHRYPKYIGPHIALGKYYSRKNDTDNSLAEFFTAGVMLHNVKLFDESLLQFRKVLAIKNDIPEVYLYLGRIFEEKDDLTMSILNYKKSNELKENIKVIVHLGYLYSQKKEYATAVRYFDRAIHLDPGNSKSYFLKGLAYSYEDKHDLAERFMKKAITIDRNDLYYFYLATVLEKRNKVKETISTLKQALKYNPRNARACNYLGYLYADKNMNLEESYRLIMCALEIEPNNGAYLDSLGWVYYRKGHYKKALTQLLKAEAELSREGSSDPVVFDHIGDTYKKTGNIKKAIDYWKKSLRIENNKSIIKKIRQYDK